MRKTIYLAGPMSGYAEHNFPAFNKAAAGLRADGHFVFNPAEGSPLGASYRQCMAVDLGWMCAHADTIALLPGWQDSRGARAEMALAECLELDVMHLGYQ